MRSNPRPEITANSCCPGSTLLDLVDRQATLYHARNKWCDRDDLLQTARITAISATRSWDPFRGTPLRNYVRAAVRRALWGHILQCRTVTHNPTREPAHRDSDIDLHPQISTNPVPTLQAIKSALIGNEIAYRALVLGETPREIAHRTGIPVVAIYAMISRGKRAIRESPQCARAWSESLGMECSPVIWHEPELLYQACCRAGIHRAGYTRKLLRSLIETRLGSLPIGAKLPKGLANRLAADHEKWTARSQIKSDYTPTLAERLHRKPPQLSMRNIKRIWRKPYSLSRELVKGSSHSIAW